MTTPEQRLVENVLVLGDPIPPIGRYSAVSVSGTTAYTSGVVALTTPGFTLQFPGRFGDDLDLESARQAARGAMLCTLANLRGELGTLDRINRFLRVTGYVQTADTVQGLPGVLDGATEVLEMLFGADTLPARTAVGVAALPGNASVELECIVELR